MLSCIPQESTLQSEAMLTTHLRPSSSAYSEGEAQCFHQASRDRTKHIGTAFDQTIKSSDRTHHPIGKTVYRDGESNIQRKSVRHLGWSGGRDRHYAGVRYQEQALMQSNNSPSRTALSVALRRAAHQSVDTPLVFEDLLAQRIVGSEAERLGLSQNAPRRNSSRTLRAFLVARSRYAEDLLAAGVHDGVTQYVLLGAGLDTFSYRNPYSGLRCFEVDHPATQNWKLGLLAEAGISVPLSTTHVPVDFEHQDLNSQLVQKGFNPHQRTFFALLGVVPYLTFSAFESTLDVIASHPSGSGFVMDYSLPRASLPYLEQLAHDSLAARVAAAGEPFQLFFDPKELHELLRLKSFARIEDLDAHNINQRYFKDREDGLAILGTAGHLLSAWKTGEE